MSVTLKSGYTENQLSKMILDAAFRAHTRVRLGFLLSFAPFAPFA